MSGFIPGPPGGVTPFVGGPPLLRVAAQPPVGDGEVLHGRHPIGHGDGEHSGGLRGPDAAEGVLADHAAGGRHGEAAGDQQEDRRVGLDPRHLVAGGDGVHRVAHPEAVEVAADPVAGRGGGDAHGPAQRAGLGDGVRHAGHQRGSGDPGDLAALPVGEQGLGVPDGAVRAGAQRLHRIEAGVRADPCGPLRQRQGRAVLGVDLLPGEERGPLGVHHQAVEVEDERPHSASSPVRLAARSAIPSPVHCDRANSQALAARPG